MNSIVVEDELFARFTRRMYWVKTTAEVELDYFLKSMTKNFYKKNRWRACYSINTNDIQPLRYQAIVDKYEPRLFETLCKKEGIAVNDIVEISCIAFGEMSILEKLNVYYGAIKDSVSTNKKIVLGGSINPKIAARFSILLQSKFPPIEVHIEGHSSNETLYLVYGETKNIIWRFLKVLPNVIWANLKKKVAI